jgi:FPC/CPF motif-containing protein YcgG
MRSLMSIDSEIATLSFDNAREQIAADFRDFVASPDFPCVGAKAALRRHQLEILVVSDIRRNTSDLLIARRLQEFTIRHDSDDKMFVSQAIIFQNGRDLSEIEFETHLWQRLTAMHVIDRRDYQWDPNIDSDPESPHFSMSIGGKGFFVVGLHPNASRAARRFKYPTMVFNLHAQFERLRDEGRYEIIRTKTIERDIALDGTANPMLARHGDGSSAAQYSGRLVSENWKCPFKHG